MVVVPISIPTLPPASFRDCASASVFAAGALSSFGAGGVATPMAVTPPIS
ncbi:hypothetical protein ACLK2E_13530 [Escherichia coli]